MKMRAPVNLRMHQEARKLLLLTVTQGLQAAVAIQLKHVVMTRLCLLVLTKELEPRKVLLVEPRKLDRRIGVPQGGQSLSPSRAGALNKMERRGQRITHVLQHQPVPGRRKSMLVVAPLVLHHP
eukprot:g8407.t1